MPTNYPTNIDSYSARTNNADTINAGDINDARDAIVAIETLLGAASANKTAWTPSFTTSGTDYTTLVYSARAGLYARLSSMVFFTFTLQINPTGTTIGSPTGNMLISGLPFTAVTTSGIGITQFYITSNFSTTPVAAYVTGTSINLFSNLTLSSVGATSLTTSSLINGGGFYFV